jgi:tight adherence protein C
MSADILDLIMKWGLKLGIILAIVAIAYVMIEGFIEKRIIEKRIKSVTLERERIRVRERAKLSGGGSDLLFFELLHQLANRTKLALWLLDVETQQKLTQAGYRDTNARSTFLVLRLVGIASATSIFVLFCVVNEQMGLLMGAPAAGFVGLRLSTYVLERRAEQRGRELNECAPDIIDLLTICVESGMSLELAMQRVADEMGPISDVVADELSLTTAELAYVPRRSDAFSNLSQRTNAKTIQDLCIALVQSDSFGTSIGSTLRVQSADARKLRQLEAERKALSIPPKLSVIMVFFFMPIIFIVMLYPTLSNMAGMKFGL